MKRAILVRLAGAVVVMTTIANCASRPELDDAVSDKSWDRADIEAVLAAAENAPAEGLDPSGYDIVGVKAALASGDSDAAAIAVSDLFARVAADLSDGQTPRERRLRWFIETPPVDRGAVAASMA